MYRIHFLYFRRWIYNFRRIGIDNHKSIFSKKDEKDLEFHEVFRVLDKFGTGRVTIQALCEFMAVFEASFDEDHALDMIRTFDTKGNGELCYEGNVTYIYC